MLKEIHDTYACVMECYSGGKHYERGMQRLELAGSDFKHPCFQLVEKAVVPEGLKEEIPEKPTLKKKG